MVVCGQPSRTHRCPTPLAPAGACVTGVLGDYPVVLPTVGQPTIHAETFESVGEALHRLLFSDRLPRGAHCSDFATAIEIERQGLFIPQGGNYIMKLTYRKINSGRWARYVRRQGDTVFDEI